MKINRARCSAALVLACSALIGSCGDDDNAATDRTATQPSTSQTLDALVDKCLATARELPDAQSRQHAEAACKASDDDAPTGPNLPTGEQLQNANKKACEEQAALETDPAIRAKVEEACKAID